MVSLQVQGGKEADTIDRHFTLTPHRRRPITTGPDRNRQRRGRRFGLKIPGVLCPGDRSCQPRQIRYRPGTQIRFVGTSRRATPFPSSKEDPMVPAIRRTSTRAGVVLGLAMVAMCAPPSRAGHIPSAALSEVDPCFISCPAGDSLDRVLLRRLSDTPDEFVEVRISLCGCPGVHVAPLSGNDAYGLDSACVLTMLTDINGIADFFPAREACAPESRSWSPGTRCRSRYR